MANAPIFGSLAPLAASFMGNQGYGGGSMPGVMPQITAPTRPSVQMPMPVRSPMASVPLAHTKMGAGMAADGIGYRMPYTAPNRNFYRGGSR